MVSWLLPYAPTGLSLIAGWCVIGATPRDQPRTPVLCTFRRPFMGRPVPRQLLRNELLDATPIIPATAYHHRSYAERYSRSKEGAHLLLQTRVRTLNGELGAIFKRWYPDMDLEVEEIPIAA